MSGSRVGLAAAVVAAAAMIFAAAGGGVARAQYQRPIEVIPQRPPPGPTGINANPNPEPIRPLTPTPVPAPAPVVVNPAPVPIPPAAGVATKRPLPRRCWCYAVNPANNARMRGQCSESCCRDNNSDERC